MQAPESIFEYIKTEESRYESEEMEIFDKWSWNMKQHIQMSMSFIWGKFLRGVNDYMRPFKKIILPILNLRFRAQDIDVKDVQLYVNNAQKYHLSFLIKKYHDEVFIKENNLDEFFDDAQESDIALGGVLIQKTSEATPEVLSLQAIAFCDQTDILAGPIGFKFNFSPDKLREMTDVGWGETKNGASISIEDLIILSEPQKDSFGTGGERKNVVTGKNIEVYIIHGNLPEHYLKDNGEMEKYVGQVQIVAFYQGAKEKQKAVLYRKEESKSPLKFHTSNLKLYGWGLGMGGAEELFEDQIWTNFLEIHKMKLLESASKVPLYTDDPTYANKNRIRDMENLEITTIADGKVIRQVPTAAPVNIQLYERSIDEWFQHAQLVGSATDPLLGKSPSAGTPFRLQERVVFEGKGIHEYRREKFAKWVEEVYRDWIIPHIAKKIVRGQEFLGTLTTDEMKWISERMASNYAEKKIGEAIFNMEIPRSREEMKQQFIQEFYRGGNKKWHEILEDEMKDAPLAIEINIAGKQKDLVQMVDKIVNIFRFVFSNPQGFQQVMQIPGMEGAFNQILEFSGLNPVDFAAASPMLPSGNPVQQGQSFGQGGLELSNMTQPQAVVA